LDVVVEINQDTGVPVLDEQFCARAFVLWSCVTVLKKRHSTTAKQPPRREVRNGLSSAPQTDPEAFVVIPYAANIRLISANLADIKLVDAGNS